MQFGYFDDLKKEYVINKPDTPGAWSNYLGSLDYGAIITNNAGGYSFVKSGANGRIIRYRFNAITTGAPGRFIYLRDQETGDFWSASWQPVGKDLKKYKSVCRHGISYTVISSEYEGIATETAYYVPLNKIYEVWAIKVKNTSSKKRKISLFNFVELSNENGESQDQVNLQYSLFISRAYYKDNVVVQTLNENRCREGVPIKKDTGMGGRGDNRFVAVVGAPVVSYDACRDTFIGNYHGYANPKAVVDGKCSNSLNYTGNTSGSMQVEVELAPGEEKEIIYLVGPGSETPAREAMKPYQTNKDQVEKELNELKNFWHRKLENFKVNTPDPSFNSMVNIWNAYQCYITFFWSRAASLVYCGLRNGLGFRDTVQDIQGIMHLDHKDAGERLRMMLSGQVSDGAGLPLVLFDHKPQSGLSLENAEYVKTTGYTEYRCDDALWLFNTVPQYIKESGNWKFIDEVIPYSDKGEDTVYEHLRKAILFSLQRLGKHGLVLGLDADWNDCLRLGEEGETVFASCQLYMALNVFKEFAERKNEAKDVDWASKEAKKLGNNIKKCAWEGDQLVRAFMGDKVIGSKNDKEANIWLNPQVWAVMSGLLTVEESKTVLDKVNKYLNTEHGTMLFYPSFTNFGLPVARMILYLHGIKENGGVFSQTQGWSVRAETMVGNGNRAFQYYQEANPARMNEHAEVREAEPYIHCQFTEGKDSPFHGRAHVHWLTGTASTVQVAAVEGILGVLPDYDGITIDPCIPSAWKEFTMERIFRGKLLSIKVQNPKGVEKGVVKMVLNGEEIKGKTIPVSKMIEKNEILVTMG